MRPGRLRPEYFIEAAGLGAFMVSACMLATLLEHPGSPVRGAIGDAFVRRLLMGIGMGLTAVAIIYSPWGQRSGAHINPSVTLTFFRLGRVDPRDVPYYVFAQFAGAVAGVAASRVALGALIESPAVNYVVTLPGSAGMAVAFVSEVAISFGLMLVVLVATNMPRLARWTGCLAGLLVATYITLEAPLSGMSMNPARTLGSALIALEWQALWLYFLAPPLGMLAAAELYVRVWGENAVDCAKLCHTDTQPCIFCEYQHATAPATAPLATPATTVRH